MGVGVAVVRLIELGERQRRLQARAARALLFRYCNCSPERFLGGSRICWAAPGHDFAAETVNEGEIAPMLNLVGKGQRFIREGGQRLTKFGRPARRIMETAPRPASVHFGHADVLDHAVFSRERFQSLGRVQRRQGVATPALLIKSRARSTSPIAQAGRASHDDA